MANRQVIAPDEVYLESINPTDGSALRSGRFKLLRGTTVESQKQDLFPPRIAINESGRAPGGLTSSVTMENQENGIGIKEQREDGSPGRCWWSTCEIDHPNLIVLPRLQTTRANSDAGSRIPRQGISWGAKVWVAFDDRVYSYTESGGWSASLHTFAGSGLPQSPPLVWGSHLYWFLGTNGITYTDGAVFTNIAVQAVGGVVAGDVLYIVNATGDVSRTATQPPTATSFVPVTSVNDTPTGMLLFTSVGGELIPYVVGQRQLWAIDINTFTYVQAGPQFPPNPWPIRAEVLTADNQVYIAQGMAVVSWDGDTAQHVGLNLDDGVPTDYRGGIVRLVNANDRLLALVDRSLLAATSDQDVWGGEPYETMLTEGEAVAGLYSKSQKGWMVRALSGAAVTTATMLFLSDSEGTYRVWYAWGGVVSTIDLPQSQFDPLEDVDADWALSGEHQYPRVDYGYHENSKVAVTVSIRTRGCSATETVKPYVAFDDSQTWYALYNPDGTHGIVTNGRHDFDIHAPPIPTSTSPLTFADEPAVGVAFDHIRVKLELARGSDSALSPGVVFTRIASLKGTQALSGWTVNLDLSEGAHDLTPHEASQMLDALIADNVTGLLHFTFKATPVAAVSTFAVKVSGYQSREVSGADHALRKTVRLSMTEV